MTGSARHTSQSKRAPRLQDDDDFPREIGTVLDSLHTHYGKESTR
jgi:hypothetical protein